MKFENLIIRPLLSLPGYLLLVGLLLSTSALRAQDTVFLLNGDVLSGRLSSDLGDFLCFEWQKKDKVVAVALEKAEVFSIRREDGQEKFFYIPDSALGREFSISQMRDFLEGERFAAKNYRPGLPLAAGVVVGAVSAYGGFWTIALSPLYLGTLSLRKPAPGETLSLPVQVKEREFFEMGYSYKARKKKLQRSALATAGGLVSVWILKVAFGGLK